MEEGRNMRMESRKEGLRGAERGPGRKQRSRKDNGSNNVFSIKQVIGLSLLGYLLLELFDCLTPQAIQ